MVGDGLSEMATFKQRPGEDVAVSLQVLGKAFQAEGKEAVRLEGKE